MGRRQQADGKSRPFPKEGKPGETRPIGIPTFEDKVLQRAVVYRALLKRLPLPPPRVVRSVYLAHAKL